MLGIKKRWLQALALLLVFSLVIVMTPQALVKVSANQSNSTDGDSSDTNVSDSSTPAAATSSSALTLALPTSTSSSASDFLVPIDPPAAGAIPISNRAGLEAIASNLSGSYYLTQDIDLSGAEWVPIGNGSSDFKGTFDGQGHVIKNLTITGVGYTYSGLFGSVSSPSGNATIKNISLENIDIDITPSSSNSWVGGICGTAYNTIINNCYASGVIDISASGLGTPYVGGICGVFESVQVKTGIFNCHNTCNVFDPNGYTGGISGRLVNASTSLTAPVDNCLNEGTVTGNTVGGISGDPSIEINNSSNTGAITGKTSGGICGNLSSNFALNISNCFNKGTIIGNSVAGGLFGIVNGTVYDTRGYTISNCFNASSVSASNTADYSSVAAGGISGRILNKTLFNSCYNTGVVSADCNGFSGGAYAGGILGLGSGGNNNDFGAINNCYNTGDISSSYSHSYDTTPGAYSGGIFGDFISMGSRTLVINNCYNIGTMSSISTNTNHFCGGICCGVNSNNSVDNSYCLSLYDSSYGAVLTKSEMQIAANFIGFDFTNVWDISATANYKYPFLRNMPGEDGGNIPVPPVDPGGAMIFVSGSPSKGSTNAFCQTNIALTFSRPIHTCSYNGIKLYKTDGQNSQPVDADIKYVDGSNVLYIIPSSVLGAGYTYYVLIIKDAIEASGNEGFDGFVDDQGYYFKTGDDIGPERTSGEYIKANSTLLYHPVIGGETFAIYRMDGKVEYDGSNFTTESGSTTDYLLDGNDYLVTSANILACAALVQSFNGKDGFNTRASEFSQNLDTEYNLLNKANSMYNALFNEYNKAAPSFNLDDVVKDGLTAALESAASANIMPLVSFGGNTTLKLTTFLQASKNYDTIRGFNSWQSVSYNNMNTEYYNAREVFNRNCLENGYIYSYNDVKTLNQMDYLYKGNASVDALLTKYLENWSATNSVSNPNDFGSNLLSLYSDVKSMATIVGIDLPKSLGSINDTISLIKTASGYVMDMKKVFDPDLVRLQSNMDKWIVSYTQDITTPAANLDLLGNSQLLSDSTNAASVILSQTIAVACPVDITVYNSSGTVIGKIVNNVVDPTYAYDESNPLVIFVENDTKILMFPSENNYRIEISATDDGLMSYSEWKTNTDGTVASETSLHGIILDNGKVFDVNPYQSENKPDYSLMFNDDEQLNVSITTLPSTNGQIVGAGDYAKGNFVTLLAEPSDGYIFGGWYENGVKISNADAAYTFTATSDRTLEARFVLATAYTITATAGVGGTVSGGGSYAKNATVTLKAVPNSGYSFSGWYENNTKVSGAGATYTFTATSDRTLEARFASSSSTGSNGGGSYVPTYPSATPQNTPVDPQQLAANELYKLNLFVGTDPTKPVFELDRNLTRLESIAIVLRLMGLEDTAQAYKGVNPFTDVPIWGDRYAAYAYSIGLTVGINDVHTLFAPDRPVTQQEFCAFLLRVLGYYEKNGDFDYANAVKKASDTGLFSAFGNTYKSGATFLRGDSVVYMVDALLTKSNGADTTLLDQLVKQGVITADAAAKFKAAVLQK